MRRTLTILSLLPLYACASNTRLKQFAEFATLGQQHQSAIGEVVDHAVASNIDANSQELLNTRELAEQNKAWRTDPDKDLETQNRAVVQFTEQYSRLKQHAALLDRYFQALAGLARYDGSGIATAAASVAGSLQTLSPSIEAMRFGGKTLPEASTILAPIVVSGVKQQRLERELRRNGDLINSQLELQERALAFVADRIKADQSLLAERRILDELALPYADLTKQVPDGWRTSRREILLQQAFAADPAAKAADLSAKLRLSFIGLLEGRLSADELADHASDVTQVLTLLKVSAAQPTGSAQ